MLEKRCFLGTAKKRRRKKCDRKKMLNERDLFFPIFFFSRGWSDKKVRQKISCDNIFFVFCVFSFPLVSFFLFAAPVPYFTQMQDLTFSLSIQYIPCFLVVIKTCVVTHCYLLLDSIEVVI